MTFAAKISLCRILTDLLVHKMLTRRRFGNCYITMDADISQ